VYLLHRFLTRIGLKRALAMELRIVQRNNRYSVGEMLLALLYPMFLGLERIETTSLLCENGVFQYLTGLPSCPNPTTLRRFLLRVAPTALTRLRALHDRFLRRMTLLPSPPAIPAGRQQAMAERALTIAATGVTFSECFSIFSPSRWPELLIESPCESSLGLGVPEAFRQPCTSGRTARNCFVAVEMYPRRYH
jgi:hypothetical protein